MKRNPNLITISKEHHHILLFVWKIKQGLKANMALERIQKYVVYFWASDLAQHIEKEKTILFKRFDSKEVRRCLDQQCKVQAYIQMICKTGSDRSDYQTICELIQQSVRYEERVVFPILEKNLPKATLEDIGRELLIEYTSREDDGFYEQELQ
ncbi:MAG: hypothetical protein EOO07_04495, partial [Chitinophagaceae bacterium]